jgi:hypothetical protein
MPSKMEHYYVYFRESRRHKWGHVDGFWASDVNDVIDLLHARLRTIPLRPGKTPGFAIIQEDSSLMLMSMAKSTFRRIPEDKRWVVEL